MSRHDIIILLILILISTACKDRDWTNIYDPNLPPSLPDSLIGTVISFKQIDLHLNGTTPNVFSYHIDRLASGEDTWIPIAQIDSSTNSFVDTTVLPTTTYIYRFYTKNKFGTSDTLYTDYLTTTEKRLMILGLKESSTLLALDYSTRNVVWELTINNLKEFIVDPTWKMLIYSDGYNIVKLNPITGIKLDSIKSVIPVKDFEWSPNGEWIGFNRGVNFTSIGVLDAATFDVQFTFGINLPILDYEISSNLQYVVVSTYSNIKVWSTTSNTITNSFDISGGFGNKVAISPNSEKFAYTSQDFTQVRNTSDGTIIWGGSFRSNDIEFSHDSDFIYTMDNRTIVPKVSKYEFPYSQESIWSSSFEFVQLDLIMTPSFGMLISYGYFSGDNKLRALSPGSGNTIWEIETRRQLNIVIDGDQEFVVANGYRFAGIYDLNTGEELSSNYYDQDIVDVRVSPVLD